MTWHIRNLTAFALVLTAAALAIASLAPPDVVPATSEAARFSAERAMKHVERIASQPHPTGSAAQADVEEYITGELTRLGWQPEVIDQVSFETRGSRLIGGTVRNVLARLRGRPAQGGQAPPGPGSQISVAQRGAILLAAHYDTQVATPGAGDDTSGVAALLETARALGAGPPLDNDVILLFSDSEETELLGAQVFVREHPWARDVRVAIDLEARGNRGPSLMFETSPGNRQLIAELDRAVDDVRAGSIFYEVYRRLPNDTDFTAFRQAGIPGYNFAFIGGLVHYHAPTDTPARLDPRSLQHHGSQALALTRHLGRLDLATLAARPGTGDAVYFNTLGGHLVTYPARWSPVLAGLLVILWLVLVRARLQRSEPSRLAFARRAGLAALAFPVILALSALSAWLACRVLGVLHPEWSAFTSGGIHDSGAVFAAIAAVTWLAAASTLGFLARRLGGMETALGVELWLVVLLVAALFTVPTAVYLLLVPLAGTVIGLLVETFLPAPATPGAARPLVRAVFALPALAIFAPATYLFFEAMSITLVVPPALCIALLAALLVPWLDALDRYRRRGMLVLASAVALVCLVRAGFLAPDRDAEHPAPSHLVYYADADAGKAAWLSRVAYLDPYSEPLFSGQAQASDLALPPTLRAARAAVAPYQTKPRPPELVALSPWIAESRGFKLALRLTVPPGMLATDLVLPASLGVVSLVIEGKPAPPSFYQPAGPYHVIHLFATNRRPFIIQITVAQKTTLAIDVIGKQPGLPALPDLAARPDDVVPAGAGSLYWPYTSYVKKHYDIEPTVEEIDAPDEGDEGDEGGEGGE